MKNRFLILACLALGLTSCASYHPVIKQSAVRQIRPGVTTEANLLALFGPPDTRVGSYEGGTNLTWFRSVGSGPAGYAPIIGQFIGGLDLEVQELIVLLDPNGRVRSYTIHDSKGAIHTQKTRLHSAAEYAK